MNRRGFFGSIAAAFVATALVTRSGQTALRMANQDEIYQLFMEKYLETQRAMIDRMMTQLLIEGEVYFKTDSDGFKVLDGVHLLVARIE